MNQLSIRKNDMGFGGEAIFQTIEGFHWDLVLMDFMLGNMDGRMMCKALEQTSETRSLPVIFISASHDLAQSLRQDGAPNDFIAKPFDIDNLLHKLERFLAS